MCIKIVNVTGIVWLTFDIWMMPTFKLHLPYFITGLALWLLIVLKSWTSWLLLLPCHTATSLSCWSTKCMFHNYISILLHFTSFFNSEHLAYLTLMQMWPNSTKFSIGHLMWWGISIKRHPNIHKLKCHYL